METDDLFCQMQDAIDIELRACIKSILKDYPSEYIEMFHYQLGWDGEKCSKDAQGKRIRPLLVLLSCHACGGDWRTALPAAAAVELVHNFSLIHDDIQDRSEVRRGRPTVWVKWGEAQAINAGDAMLTVAHLEILQLEESYNHQIVNSAVKDLQSACLKLTRGQHLDIAFEQEKELSIELYWQMIEGKTSALLTACFLIGALLAGSTEDVLLGMTEYGNTVGAAYQVQDDWLGIWGDMAVTGKSSMSDLISKKKTYPVLLGTQHGGGFSRRWNELEGITEQDAHELTSLLETENIHKITRQKFEELYQQARAIFIALDFDAQRAAPFRQVVESLFGRIR